METENNSVRTTWFLLIRKGPNFRTSVPVLKNDSVLIIKKTTRYMVLQAIIFVLGTGLIILSAVTYEKGIDYTGNLIGFSIGLVFALTGFGLWFKGKRQIFDKKPAVYLRGKKTIPFKNIIAVQIIKKYVRNNRKSSGYYCYETNLIERSGTRKNVLNNGGEFEPILKDAETLAKFLNVPLLLDKKIDR